MDMDIAPFEESLINSDRRRPGLDDAERRLSALLHDLAELPGEDEPAAAGHPRRFDEQDVAADRRPGKAGGHARNAGAQSDFILEAQRAKDGSQVMSLDTDRDSLPLGDAN